MGKLKKLKNDLVVGAHALFRGMAAADATIQGPVGSSDGVESVQQLRTGGGVFSDMLEEKQTQRVVEMRDKYYRVFKEADKYDASKTKMVEHTIINEEGEEEEVVDFEVTTVRKKTKADFMKHPLVMEVEGTTLRTIQDNKHIVKHNGIVGMGDSIDGGYFGNGLYDFQTTLTLERDGFVPRFEIEKFTKRMVVRNVEGTDRAFVDFYVPAEPSQFGKIDAMLIANLNRIMETKDTRSDITDLKVIEWYSDKAWNSEDVALFKYDDVHFKEINIFDGSFVLTFDCNIVNNGTDLSEKYKTKELDEKYATKAPKHDNIDIFTLQRHIEQESAEEKEINVDNLSTTTLTLGEE